MELVKDTVMEAAWQVWQARPPQPSLTVVVKATYALAAEGDAALSESQALPTGDEHHDDDPERSLRYASDLDYLKPHAECLVVGSVRPPGGAEMFHTKVEFEIGPVKKQLAVFGDRAWRRGRATAPAPITEVPLSWERAFGGPGLPDNPVGSGLRAAAGEDVVRLPNIEDPATLIMSRDARPAPASCGPIPRTWPARMRFAGTYDAAWFASRYPWFADDLDWRYFCAAPPDQQIQGYWRGDEEIVLQNLHPQHPRVRCRLPGHVAHAYLVPQDGRPMREVGLRLDTITVDADEGVAYCVWRGVAEVDSEDLSGISQLFVTHAPAGEAIDPAARRQAKLDADAAAEAELAAEPVPLPAPSPSAAMEPSDEPAAAATAGSVDPSAPDAKWAHLDQAMTIRAEDTTLQDALREAWAERERGGLGSVFDDALGLERPLSAERQLSPEELLELEMMDALGDLLEPEQDERRQAVRDAVSRGESLQGRDLSGVDLSGVGLVGADLRGAILSRANFSGAHLERCRFDGANLSEAELSLGSFDGCSFVGADMTSVRAHRVRFHRCRLDDAALLVSYLREARLMSTDLRRSELGGSDLTEANLRDCELAEADLSGCLLARATFSRCHLLDAWLSGVDAPGVVLDGCDAPLLRLSDANLEEASFKKATLDGARFGSARLDRANLNLARLSRADFSDALLNEATLMGCDLRMARFDGAALVGGSLMKSNLMQARFEKANLSRADLRGANLFEAELLGAKLEGARTDLANFDRTRLGGGT